MRGRSLIRWFGVAAVGSLLLSLTCFSQSVGFQESSQKHQFIASFDWSVERSDSYTWPFDSMRPAPDKAVLIVFERMPRARSERGQGKKSVALAPLRVLKINGQPLPKPQRLNGSQEASRVSLVKGRLRFSFSLPSGFKLDPGHTTVRVKLYEAI